MNSAKALILTVMLAALALVQAFGPMHGPGAALARADSDQSAFVFCATDAPPPELVAEMQRIYGAPVAAGADDGPHAGDSHCPLCTLQHALAANDRDTAAVRAHPARDAGPILAAFSLLRAAPVGASLGPRAPPVMTL